MDALTTPLLTGTQPGVDPAAGRARPDAHVRPDGRDQHGERRVPHGRRLRGVRHPAGDRRAPGSRSLVAHPGRPSSSPACSGCCSRSRSSSGCTSGRSTRCWRPSAWRWSCSSSPGTSSAPRATRSARRAGCGGSISVFGYDWPHRQLFTIVLALGACWRSQRRAQVQLVRPPDPGHGAEPRAGRDDGRLDPRTSTASPSSSAPAWPASAASPSP